MNENRSPADSLSPEKMQLFLATLAFAAARDSEGEAALYSQLHRRVSRVGNDDGELRKNAGVHVDHPVFLADHLPAKKDD